MNWKHIRSLLLYFAFLMVCTILGRLIAGA
jgi:hypothetical protein